jgi:methoxymalonate biosynthesis acyl carrier protein
MTSPDRKPPSDLATVRIRSFLHGELREEIPDDEDIFATGRANSLLAMTLVTFVESEFGFTVESEDLDPANFCSIAAISAFVGRRHATAVGDKP